jgi:hypothetical protein
MALLKRILKMAQLDPLYSRHGMLAGSFSMVVEVAVGRGVVTVDITFDLMDEGVERPVERPDSGMDELEGLVLACWAGPITCR